LRYRQALAAAFFISATACTGGSVTFESGPGTAASLVTWDRLDKDGTSLGPMPVTVANQDLAGKVVKLTAKGKDPVFWVLEESTAEAMKVHLELPTTQCSVQDNVAAKKDGPLKLVPDVDNRLMRLTLRAYKALWSQDLELTRRLASELHDLRPELAVSSLLTGLASLAGGERQQARTALTAAKTLDPEDPDIDELLKMAE
jgi:hypothetical protein